MPIKHQRRWRGGLLVREILNGSEVTENIGKTHAELGIGWVKRAVSVTQPIPREDWSIWATALAMVAKPEDKGIGDIVARTIGDENSDAFKKWFKATTGKDCGCTGRQARYNLQYPL